MENEKLKTKLTNKIITLIDYICFIYFATGVLIGANSLKGIPCEGFKEWIVHMLFLLINGLFWLPVAIAEIVINI